MYMRNMPTNNWLLFSHPSFK